MKTKNATSVEDAKEKISDIEVFGNGDTWKCICKASSKKEGWMKSTKAIQIGTGCLVQVTTHQENADGTHSIAEAITYVPSARIIEGEDGNLKIW